MIGWFVIGFLAPALWFYAMLAAAKYCLGQCDE
jgi:hypothetical protein